MKTLKVFLPLCAALISGFLFACSAESGTSVETLSRITALELQFEELEKQQQMYAKSLNSTTLTLARLTKRVDAIKGVPVDATP